MKQEIIVSMVVCLFLVSVFMIYQEQISRPKDLAEINYEGLAMLGLIPNAPSRAITPGDIDTGLRAGYQGSIYGVYESRNFNTLDYGKFFVSVVNG